MRPPRLIPFRRFKKLLRRYGIEPTPGGKHPIFVSPDGRKFPMPNLKPSSDVERAYVDAARRKFQLMPQDGVSDDEFYEGG